MRYLSIAEAARSLRVTSRTIPNWARKGYIHLYRSGDGSIVVDMQEVERALQTHGPAKMRDGRRRYGTSIAPLPIQGADK